MSHPLPQKTPPDTDAMALDEQDTPPDDTGLFDDDELLGDVDIEDEGDDRMVEDTTATEDPVPGEHTTAEYGAMGKEAWDNFCVAMQQALRDEYEKQVPLEAIEAYLNDERGIEPPLGAFYDIDDEDDYHGYLQDLESVTADDVFYYLFGPRSTTLQPSDEDHYSSEDDEEPLDRADFDYVLSMASYLNEATGRMLARMPGRDKFEKETEAIAAEIQQYRKEKGAKARFPVPFHPVRLAAPSDWPAFAAAMAVAKKKPQKPTVYEYLYDVWPKAGINRVAFRGKVLQCPDGSPGRSWPAIALSLDTVATKIGSAIVLSGDRETISRVGDRLLANAILFILAGRGEEVRATLAKYGFTDFAEFESNVVEFLTLTMGVECIRLPYCLIDTILHLANIASGAGFGPLEKPYAFLNVYSSARSFASGHNHVFIKGIYGKNKKELTTYGGFKRASLGDTLTRKMGEDTSKEKAPLKSAKSVGKSAYSHSAGHTKVIRLLERDEDIVEALWKQVRPGSERNRRRRHADRLTSMGPIRVYNLVANLLWQYRTQTGSMRSTQAGAQVSDVLRCFFTGGQPGQENIFRQHLPTLTGATYAAVAQSVLQQEKVQPIEGNPALLLVTDALSTPRYDDLDRAYKENTPLMPAIAAHLVPTGHQSKKDSALHLAVRSGRAWLVAALIDAGADPTAENGEGMTALALALSQKDDEIAALLKKAQARQQDRLSVPVPEQWAKAARQVTTAAWLDDAEVRALLLGLNLPDTHIVPAVDIATNPDTLAAAIRDNYLDQMVHGGVRRFTVVPVNFRNAHWATLVIVQNPARRSRPEVYFFDSLGSSAGKIYLIKAMLVATGVYVSVQDIADFSAPLQTDGSTCGTWMVRAAQVIVTGLRTGKTREAIMQDLRGLVTTIKAVHGENLKNTRKPTLT